MLRRWLLLGLCLLLLLNCAELVPVHWIPEEEQFTTETEVGSGPVEEGQISVS